MNDHIPKMAPVDIATPLPGAGEGARATTTTTRPTNGNRRGSLLSRVVSSVRSLHNPENNAANDDDDDSGSDTSSLREFNRHLSRLQSNATEGGFNLDTVMAGKAERERKEGKKERRIDVGWKGLCVRGVGADVVYAEDLAR